MFHRQRRSRSDGARVEELSPLREQTPDGRSSDAPAAESHCAPLGMDGGPHHGARDRSASPPALVGSVRQRRHGPPGRSHAARRGLCDDRRPYVLHDRIGIGDRVDRARIGGVGWLYSPALSATFGSGVTPASSGQPLFVGIGPSTDVDRYLAGVDHTVITEFWGDKTETVEGGPPDPSRRAPRLLGRLRTGSGPSDARLGSCGRVMDCGRDERRRSARDRCRSGPGARPSSGPAVDCPRLPSGVGDLDGGWRALGRGCFRRRRADQVSTV